MIKKYTLSLRAHHITEKSVTHRHDRDAMMVLFFHRDVTSFAVRTLLRLLEYQ